MDYVRIDFNYQWGNSTQRRAYVQAQCKLCGGIGEPVFPHKAEHDGAAVRTQAAEARTRASVKHTHACALDKAAGAV